MTDASQASTNEFTNDSLTNKQGAFEEVAMTLRDHVDPDKHWMGEGLPVPSDSEVKGVGVIKTAGTSKFPARADHEHGLLLPNTQWNLGGTQEINQNSTTLLTGFTYAAAIGTSNWVTNTNTVTLPYTGLYFGNVRVNIAEFITTPAIFSFHFRIVTTPDIVISRKMIATNAATDTFYETYSYLFQASAGNTLQLVAYHRGTAAWTFGIEATVSFLSGLAA
jgi:hypothetical protein